MMINCHIINLLNTNHGSESMKYIILSKKYDTYYIHNQNIKTEDQADLLCDTMNKIDDGYTYTVIEIPEEHNLEVVNEK